MQALCDPAPGPAFDGAAYASLLLQAAGHLTEGTAFRLPLRFVFV
jgi:hypothetical protein